MPRKLLVSGFVLLILIVAIVSYLSSRINFDDLSVNQLTAGGYYAYVLPDSTEAELGWIKIVRMNGFDWQCNFFLNDDWNPINIYYKNARSGSDFEIRIEQTDAIFEDSKATEIVSVNADWIPTRTGLAYPNSEETRLKVHDILGMEVVFVSRMEIDDLLPIIAKLQYVGPNLESVGNPWKRACE